MMADELPQTVSMPQSDGVDHPIYDVKSLLDGSERAILVLDGRSYTLRITRQGKLLLTK